MPGRFDFQVKKGRRFFSKIIFPEAKKKDRPEAIHFQPYNQPKMNQSKIYAA
jgi:hypothetical protein